MNRFDINDIILKLIAKDLPQLFDACYLDEVQDFSYAAIYFISSIAGKDTLNWVCAGDTAQMISPGCSFKFDGLKQVMRTVRNDETIDHRLKKVVNLKVNYRTTQDILKVANVSRYLQSYFCIHLGDFVCRLNVTISPQRHDLSMLSRLHFDSIEHH